MISFWFLVGAWLLANVLFVALLWLTRGERQ